MKIIENTEEEHYITSCDINFPAKREEDLL
jgi:hypothetical protein